MRTRFFYSVLVCGLALGANAARLQAQAAATVCKDGTTSATSGRGACSGHGGVDATATAAAKKAAKAAKAETKKAEPKAEKKAEAKVEKKAEPKAETKKAEPKKETKAETKKAPAATKAADVDNNDPKDATAQCKDGTYSHAATHQGACSRHGGVAKFLKP